MLHICSWSSFQRSQPKTNFRTMGVKRRYSSYHSFPNVEAHPGLHRYIPSLDKN
uniref:Uncharacterized protein n=1 Tax=Rhizophora mucronata TaxID=61149 RepID=A0A2P2K4P7_RHIMU